MAGGRQPIEVLKAKGAKHLTKKEIEERTENELKIETKEVICPSYLPASLKNEFDNLSQRLLDLQIFSDLDVDLLARYLISKQQYLLYTSKIPQLIKKNDILTLDKFSQLQDKAFKQCHCSARELGLTISSRCKLVIPKVQKEEKNKFEEFFEGG